MILDNKSKKTFIIRGLKKLEMTFTTKNAIDSLTKNKMNSVSLSEADIFRTTNELTKSFISENEKDTIDFTEINKHANNLKKEILIKSLAIDQALNPFIEAEITRIEKHLEAIQSKLEKSVKLKHEKALKTIGQIKEKLFLYKYNKLRKPRR